MALRTKTIEYAFPFSTASVATATARDFTSITLYIPEASPTFRSVILECTAADNVTTAASTTAVLMGISLGAVGRNDATVTQTIANSGENYSVIFTRDVTSYFTTNWTGTSMACGARLTVTGPSTNNATAKLIITYEYEDSTATTRIKTVKIPVEGNTGNLTTTLTNLGGVANQFPALDTFLPESSKVYRNIFFETYGHTNATSDVNGVILSLRLDDTNTLNSAIYEDALITDRWIKRIDNLTGIATDNAHNVQAAVDNTGSNFPCLSGVIVVTYEYDHSASTTIMNSIQLPIIDEAGFAGGSTSANQSRFQRNIYIQEPGTITMQQSAVMMTYSDTGGVGVILNTGSQAARTYTQPASVRSGCMTIMRRIDSGSSGGVAGMTLARGSNTITVDYYSNSAVTGSLGTNFSALLFLNYTSSKAAQGDGAHNHTTQWISRPHATGNAVNKLTYTPSTTPIIPESMYWLTNSGFEIYLQTSGTGSSNLGLAYLAQVNSNEGQGAGWLDIYSSFYLSDAEVGPNVVYCRSRSLFKRWPNDTDTERLNIETSRSFRFDSTVANATFWQSKQYITYHSITQPISGTISGSAGGTIEIIAYNTNTGQEVGYTTRIGNGTYTIDWIDDTEAIYVVAYETSALNGVSQVAVAGSGFNIDLAGGGAPVSGPTYYAYS